ncbi:MAG: hypothetical protein Kow00128_20260 [Deltaproteobacteria bacterium]
MKVVRLNADVEVDAARRLRHLLLDEGITFATWLRRQIDAYVAEREPKGKRRKERKG